MEGQAKAIFGNTVKITSEGKRHLGAVIGSIDYNKEFCEEKVDVWIKELKTLCEIATTYPQMAYSAYLKGYKSKFTYFLRTIENFHNFVSPIDQLLSENFIPTLFGYDTALDEYRDLFSLNPGEGGLGISILSNEAQEQHASSLRITKPHVESIIEQDSIMRSTNPNGKTTEEIKIDEKRQKQALRKEKIELIDTKLPARVISYVKQARDKGASSWLNALPIEDQQFVLNKGEFKDALRIRYNIELQQCVLVERDSMSHML